MTDWREGVRPVDVFRLHWGWLGTSAVLWVLIGLIVVALIKGWPKGMDSDKIRPGREPLPGAE